MKKTMTGPLALVVALVCVNSALAHHSLANYDTEKAVRVKGTIVRFHRINPHSFIYLDEQGPDGHTRRWAVEGPALRQLDRSGTAKDLLKPGDVVEVCGYVPRETVIWQIAGPDTGTNSVAGRLINAELLVMSDGYQRSWGDYGVHRCFAPGYSDRHQTQ